MANTAFLARAGEANAALDEVERLIGRASFVTVRMLRMDPLWDPIRDHPRFRPLLRRNVASALP